MAEEDTGKNEEVSVDQKTVDTEKSKADAEAKKEAESKKIKS